MNTIDEKKEPKQKPTSTERGRASAGNDSGGEGGTSGNWGGGATEGTEKTNPQAKTEVQPDTANGED